MHTPPILPTLLQRGDYSHTEILMRLVLDSSRCHHMRLVLRLFLHLVSGLGHCCLNPNQRGVGVCIAADVAKAMKAAYGQ